MRRLSIIAAVVLVAVSAWWLSRDQTPAPPPATVAPVDAGAPVSREIEVRVVEEESGVVLPHARVVLLNSSGVISDDLFIVREWTADEQGKVKVELLGQTGALEARAAAHVWSAPLEVSELGAQVTLRCLRGVPVTGRVVDPKGNALGGIDVTGENEALRLPNGPPRRTWSRTRTDAKGQFRLEVLDGEVLVRAGSGPWKVTEARFATPSKALWLVLQPGFAVRGQVLRADGGEAGASEVEYGAARPALTDEHGRFELQALAHAELTLTAQSPDGDERSTELEANLKPGTWTEISLSLRRALRIVGVVTDALGQPVSGASLDFGEVGDDDRLVMTLADWIGAPELRSGPQGEFSLPTDRIDTTTTFEVLGWTRGAQGRVRATPGQRVELVLRQVPMVQGTVVDAAGRPLPRFTLDRRAADSPDGTFAVARSELGETLNLSAEGFASKVVALPDAGVELGKISLARTHRRRWAGAFWPLARAVPTPGERRPVGGPGDGRAPR